MDCRDDPVQSHMPLHQLLTSSATAAAAAGGTSKHDAATPASDHDGCQLAGSDDSGSSHHHSASSAVRQSLQATAATAAASVTSDHVTWLLEPIQLQSNAVMVAAPVPIARGVNLMPNTDNGRAGMSSVACARLAPQQQQQAQPIVIIQGHLGHTSLQHQQLLQQHQQQQAELQMQIQSQRQREQLQQQQLQQLHLMQQLHQQQQCSSPAHPFNTVKLTDLVSAKVMQDAHATFRQQLDAAYASGFTDGMEAMRHKLAAAQRAGSAKVAAAAAAAGAAPPHEQAASHMHAAVHRRYHHHHHHQQQQRHVHHVVQHSQQRQHTVPNHTVQPYSKQQPHLELKRRVSSPVEGLHPPGQKRQRSTGSEALLGPPVAAAVADASVLALPLQKSSRHIAAAAVAPAAAAGGVHSPAAATDPGGGACSPSSPGAAPADLPPRGRHGKLHPRNGSSNVAAAAAAADGYDLLAPANLVAMDRATAEKRLKQLSDEELLQLAFRAVCTPVQGCPPACKSSAAAAAGTGHVRPESSAHGVYGMLRTAWSCPPGEMLPIPEEGTPSAAAAAAVVDSLYAAASANYSGRSTAAAAGAALGEKSQSLPENMAAAVGHSIMLASSQQLQQEQEQPPGSPAAAAAAATSASISANTLLVSSSNAAEVRSAGMARWSVPCSEPLLWHNGSNYPDQYAGDGGEEDMLPNLTDLLYVGPDDTEQAATLN